MKKKIFSTVIVAMLAVAIAIPAATAHSYAAFSVRSSLPSFTSAEGKAYYYTNNNIFYANNLGPNGVKISGGYCTGNCTWYAYARASEILGKNLNTNFRWAASKWWDLNKTNNYYSYGSTPKVGAIACYSSHVAIVESVDSKGNITVSESGWRVSANKPLSASDVRFHYGSPWYSNPKGYIYIADTAASSATSVNYSVKVSAKDLNMRTGPGTGYSKIGYIKPGTYQITQETNGWGKLASNGYWICLKYTTKASTPSSNVANTGTTVNYKVNVSITNLNMRTGPGTSYAKNGYIKPGTYTIIQEKSGWGKTSETGYWIYLQYAAKVDGSSTSTTSNSSASASLYKVKINATGLNMRTGPGTNYSSKGKVTNGLIYDIKDTKNGWGQLSKNGYWIKLSYTIPVNSSYNVKVTAKDLNMRTGPGTNYAKKGYIKPGTHTISQTSGGWGKLASNGYWINLSYTTKI